METMIIEPPTRQEQILRLYQRSFPKVAYYISKTGGSLEDVKDTFQDALLVFYEKEDRSGIKDEALYVTGIAKHLWLKKQEKERRIEKKALPAEDESERPVSTRLLRYVEAAGKKCMEMLKGVYYDNMNMKELAATFGFSGERSATAQKYKCLEKIREVIKQRALSKEDFYE